MGYDNDWGKRFDPQTGRLEKNAPSSCTSGLLCSIAMSEGELIDLQGIESWLSASDDVCPPDPLGRGVRLRWLKTLSHILNQSNAEHEPRALASRDPCSCSQSGSTTQGE